MKLLLVEDDAVLARSLAAELRDFDHDVTVVGDGRSALRATADEPFEAIVLDWMLPARDGISVLEELRASKVRMPVIMMSALGRTAEKVRGLETGADDYVVKPVSGEELNARLIALVRGRQWMAGEAADTIEAGDIKVSPTRLRAWRAGHAIDLNPMEMKLLIEFVQNADGVLTRAMLIERVWRYDWEPSAGLVDTYVSRLRAKLMAHGGIDPIVTMRGIGYKMRA